MRVFCLLAAILTVVRSSAAPQPGKERILWAQILLARSHFSPGEIDGRGGDNFVRALKGFQQARDLPQTGRLDRETLAALSMDATPVMKTYTVNEQDVAGPFTPVPQDMMDQAKMDALGYESVGEALAERFHISPALLKRLNPNRRLVAGTELQVPDTGTSPTGKATKVVVTAEGALTAFDGSGNLIAQYPCSSGSKRDPLPLGDWKILKILRDPTFYYDPSLFWDAKPEHSKAKIAPGPNNPVGLVWIDLSKEHYGIHGTPNPATVGHEQSHGCIRLTNWDARELADLVSRNTVVICQK